MENREEKIKLKANQLLSVFIHSVESHSLQLKQITNIIDWHIRDEEYKLENPELIEILNNNKKN